MLGRIPRLPAAHVHARTLLRARTLPPPAPPIFPLSVHASNRYLVDAQGSPFLLHGDTPWSIVAQLSDAQVDTYVATRAAQGFTAILFNAIEHAFSSQSPAYNNADGVAPFASMTDFASSLNSGYWNRVDRIVNACKAANMLCIINPAYMGYNSTQGWQNEVNAESDADLQTYGTALANRFTQGNVAWCMGGDTSTGATKQWNIITGMRTVRTTDLISGHAGRSTEAYTNWSAFTGFNFNSLYCASDGTDAYSMGATAYGRSLPFFMLEAGYEGERTLQEARRAAYTAMLSGACGHFFGNNPVWGFGEPNYCGGAGAAAAMSSLSSTGAAQMGHLKSLLAAYQWWKLEPKTDTSVVSSTLSSGSTRVCPALASDGTFAMVYVQDARTVTLVKSALSVNPLRIRQFNVTTGAWSTLSASEANSGTYNAGVNECVIVMDAA